MVLIENVSHIKNFNETSVQFTVDSLPIHVADCHLKEADRRNFKCDHY